MSSEIMTVAGVVLSAIGVWFGWYNPHRDRMDKKREKEEQEANQSIGVNVAAGHFSG